MQGYQHFLLKDYYYFLGITPDASAEDIRRAYRKLSLKYHPDKNANDEFFEKRFREVQEAYNTLADAEKRRLYDENYQHQQRSYRSALPPVIQSFHTTKVRVRKGEEVTVTWKTNNADVVKILPFGLVRAYGEKTFKITEFKDGKFQLLLHASNTLMNKTVVKALIITQISSAEQETFKDSMEELFRNQKRTPANPSGQPKFFRFLMILVLLLLAVYFLMKEI